MIFTSKDSMSSHKENASPKTSILRRASTLQTLHLSSVSNKVETERGSKRPSTTSVPQKTFKHSSPTPRSSKQDEGDNSKTIKRSLTGKPSIPQSLFRLPPTSKRASFHGPLGNSRVVARLCTPGKCSTNDASTSSLSRTQSRNLVIKGPPVSAARRSARKLTAIELFNLNTRKNEVTPLDDSPDGNLCKKNASFILSSPTASYSIAGKLTLEALLDMSSATSAVIPDPETSPLPSSRPAKFDSFQLPFSGYSNHALSTPKALLSEYYPSGPGSPVSKHTSQSYSHSPLGSLIDAFQSMHLNEDDDDDDTPQSVTGGPALAPMIDEIYDQLPSPWSSDFKTLKTVDNSKLQSVADCFQNQDPASPSVAFAGEEALSSPSPLHLSEAETSKTSTLSEDLQIFPVTPTKTAPTAPRAADILSSSSPFLPRVFKDLAGAYIKFGITLIPGPGALPDPSTLPSEDQEPTKASTRNAQPVGLAYGDVLERARKFGETLWSPSAKRTKKVDVIFEPDSANASKAPTLNGIGRVGGGRNSLLEKAISQRNWSAGSLD